MKLYVIIQVYPQDGDVLGQYVYPSEQRARAALDVFTSLLHHSRYYLHEIDMDPTAGFQTVNITQVSLDGTRHDAEYRQEQADKIRQFNTAHPLT